jgi:hypothetical protein
MTRVSKRVEILRICLSKLYLIRVDFQVRVSKRNLEDVSGKLGANSRSAIRQSPRDNFLLSRDEFQFD